MERLSECFNRFPSADINGEKSDISHHGILMMVVETSNIVEHCRFVNEEAKKHLSIIVD